MTNLENYFFIAWIVIKNIFLLKDQFRSKTYSLKDRIFIFGSFNLFSVFLILVSYQEILGVMPYVLRYIISDTTSPQFNLLLILAPIATDLLSELAIKYAKDIPEDLRQDPLANRLVYLVTFAFMAIVVSGFFIAILILQALGRGAGN